jgi:hypothetical protein
MFEDICVFDRVTSCKILKRRDCILCPFAKTEAEYESGRAAAERRLKRLGIYEEMDAVYRLEG